MVVGVAFDVPVVVVDESVVVVTQAGEVGHGGVTAVGGDRANRGEGRDDLPVTVDDQRRDDPITGQALRGGGSDGRMRHPEPFQHPHRMVL